MTYSPTKPSPPLPACSRCGSKKIKKKGRRKTRHDLRQRYGCNACDHTFVKEHKHSSYPVKLIIAGISFYNLGYSARKTRNYLKRRFDIKPPEKTFRFWYTSHKPIYTYEQIHDQIKKHHAPSQLVEKLYLQHRQVYLYQLHKGKLDLLFSYRCPPIFCFHFSSFVFPHIAPCQHGTAGESLTGRGLAV